MHLMSNETFNSTTVCAGEASCYVHKHVTIAPQS